MVSWSNHGQNLKALSYHAYLDNDLSQWKYVVQQAANANDNSSSSTAFDHAFAQYGLLAHCMYTGNEMVFDEHVKFTNDLLEELIDSDEFWAEPKAVASFIMGFQVANSPMKAVYLGPKSSKLMKEAATLNSQSPIVVQLYAGSKYFSPKLFGGDLNEAITSYTVAIKLFEEQNRTDEWLYLDAMAFLGKSYMRIGDVEKAIAIYEKALGIEPDFVWIRDMLLPSAQDVNLDD